MSAPTSVSSTTNAVFTCKRVFNPTTISSFPCFQPALTAGVCPGRDRESRTVVLRQTACVAPGSVRAGPFLSLSCIGDSAAAQLVPSHRERPQRRPEEVVERGGGVTDGVGCMLGEILQLELSSSVMMEPSWRGTDVKINCSLSLCGGAVQCRITNVRQNVASPKPDVSQTIRSPVIMGQTYEVQRES